MSTHNIYFHGEIRKISFVCVCVCVVCVCVCRGGGGRAEINALPGANT